MRRNRGKKSEAKLNITSLLDMFTIMLLFLLVNFNSENENAKLHPDVTLPSSQAELGMIKAIDVILTKNELLLEDRVIMRLEGGKFPKQTLEGDTIKPFYDALVQLKAQNSKFEKRQKSKGSKGEDQDQKHYDVILFQSDKAMAFNMIDKVMMTTAQAGYEKFKFAVLKKE